MIRSRTLPLLALAAILATAGAGLAGPADLERPVTAPDVAAVTSLTAAAPAEAASCAATNPAAGFLPEPVQRADYILCSCELCRAHPDIICQISPTGFSIVCSDYFAAFC